MRTASSEQVRQPTYRVGMYLDEQPITTIQGALDIQMYDIERVEALAGPQGTLFGASSQAGTVRLIGWQKHDAGYVDNLLGTRTYPTSGIVDDNANLAEKNYNTADTAGMRASARFDINGRWTITPQLMAQKQKADGSARTSLGRRRPHR